MRPLLVLALSAIAVGCTNTGPTRSDDSISTATAPIASVTAPAIRLTPFCQAMIELDQALPADPSIDATDQILAAYLAARPDVPQEIAADFDAVITQLQTGVLVTAPPDTTGPAATGQTTVPTTDPTNAPSTVAAPGTTTPQAGEADPDYDGEGYLPADTPAVRVNSYIDLACRNTQNNPGPPATQPDEIAPPTTTP